MIARAGAPHWVAILLGLVAVAAPAATQDVPLVSLAAAATLIVVDADDDDDDGTIDALGVGAIPVEDLRSFVVQGARRGSAVTLTVDEGLRLVRNGTPLASPLVLRASELPASLHVQALRAREAASPARIVAERDGQRAELAFEVVALSFLDAGDARIDPSTDAVGLSHRITNDASLPRDPGFDRQSEQDADNLRIEIFDPFANSAEIHAATESTDAGPGTRRAVLGPLSLRSTGARPHVFRSPFLRLVGDRMDAEAPGVTASVLRVALRDRVRIRYQRGAAEVTQDVRVGRPGDEDGPKAAREATLRIHVLRIAPGAGPVLGADDAAALRIARAQVAIANEIWLQCFLTFGDPERADVRLVDPPPPALVAFGDHDGLPATGGGTIRLRAAGRSMPPVQTRPGASPLRTALDVAARLQTLGFVTQVTENAATELGAGRSADIVVRTRDGQLVRLEPDGGLPLGTDARQTVRLGVVDLADGLREFDNMTAQAGTLEERALLKLVGDGDPSTIELYVINRFTNGTRQGEAFIEGDGGGLVNAFILDRNGILQEREAWTQSHELGHVLLNQPYHPDNVGTDRPWLLMDADSSVGLVTGPKRLSWDECHRMTVESGVDAVPALLRRHDARSPPPTSPARAPFELGYAR